MKNYRGLALAIQRNHSIFSSHSHLHLDPKRYFYKVDFKDSDIEDMQSIISSGKFFILGFFSLREMLCLGNRRTFHMNGDYEWGIKA